MSQERKTDILIALFVGSLVAANSLGIKVMEVTPPGWLAAILNVVFWPLIFVLNALMSVFFDTGIQANPFLEYAFFDVFHVSVGIFFLPVMFLVTDIIAEVHGRKKAQNIVYGSVITMVFILLISWISMSVNYKPRPGFDHEAYLSVFSMSSRMMVASVIAFFFAQLHDVWAFEFWKSKTKGRFLWLRNNLSTFVSQFLDSALFIFIAFYSQGNIQFLMSLILPYWIFKILFALLDTPLCYT